MTLGTQPCAPMKSRKIVWFLAAVASCTAPSVSQAVVWFRNTGTVSLRLGRIESRCGLLRGELHERHLQRLKRDQSQRDLQQFTHWPLSCDEVQERRV